MIESYEECLIICTECRNAYTDSESGLCSRCSHQNDIDNYSKDFGEIFYNYLSLSINEVINVRHHIKVSDDRFKNSLNFPNNFIFMDDEWFYKYIVPLHRPIARDKVPHYLR